MMNEPVMKNVEVLVGTQDGHTVVHFTIYHKLTGLSSTQAIQKLDKSFGSTKSGTTLLLGTYTYSIKQIVVNGHGQLEKKLAYGNRRSTHCRELLFADLLPSLDTFFQLMKAFYQINKNVVNQSIKSVSLSICPSVTRLKYLPRFIIRRVNVSIVCWPVLSEYRSAVLFTSNWLYNFKFEKITVI